MAQQIINVGSAPNDGTGDLLRVSQQKANANFTDLYNNKQDNLTAQNFGTFSNGLTTEDAIVDTDLINFTDVSDANKQKKTTWSNLKAKLKTYFDAFYQVILVSGTNIKTINGTSILGGGNIVTTSTQTYFNITGNTTLDSSYNNSILRIKGNAVITIPSGLPADFNFVVAIYSGFTYTQVAGAGVTQSPTTVTKSGENMLTTFVDGTNNYKTFGV